MIARTECCTKVELELLLDDAVDSETAEQFTEHVESCIPCQQKMIKIAGDEHWWSESKSYLASISQDSNDFESTTQARPPRPQHVPEQLAHYRIESVIGFGGMATVYRALDRELNRPVAIKVLHQHLSASGNSRQRFLREAQSAASIAHANVIPIYGVHNLDGYSFLAMPLIVGGSLQQRIDREGPLALADVLRIGLQIAEALDAAHLHGVVHRDVKPANILLEDGSLRVLLSDFGLARTLDDSTLTASGMIAGTPAFMSPEQARGESIDFRSDLFSLGSVLFAMATGHAPFQSPSTLKVLRSVGSEPFPSVHRYQEHLPVWLDRLIGLLTASEASKRLPDAKTAAEIMRQSLAYCSNPKANTLPTILTSSSRSSLKAITTKQFLTTSKGRYATRTIRLAALLSVACVSMVVLGILWNTITAGTSWRRNDSRTENSALRVNRNNPGFVSNNPTATLPVVPLGSIANSTEWDDGLEPSLLKIENGIKQLSDEGGGLDTEAASSNSIPMLSPSMNVGEKN